MKRIGSKTPYADLVAQAESAVSGVKDAELRRVAFERVLEDLLGKRPASRPDTPAVQNRPKGGSPRSKRRATSRVTGPSVSKGAGRAGPQARVEELAGDGFFAKQKTISAVKAELENRGHHIPLTSLSGPLQKLCQKKVLRRQKVDGEGKKKTYAYSNW